MSGVQIGAVEPNLAEPLTLTPIEIQQMCLTPEQVQQIKAKKVKRIEKHGKIVKKVSSVVFMLYSYKGFFMSS